MYLLLFRTGLKTSYLLPFPCCCSLTNKLPQRLLVFPLDFPSPPYLPVALATLTLRSGPSVLDGQMGSEPHHSHSCMRLT